MWKLSASVAAVALVALGGEGLYHAFRGRERVDVDCRDLAASKPSSHRLHVTGCEVEYGGIGYRGDAPIEELFLPAKPVGRAMAAPIVIVTRDPAALAMAQPLLAGDRSVPSDQSLAAVRKIVEGVRAHQSIDGLARAGLIERLRTRRILSGLTATPVAPDALLIDLDGKPDFFRPILAIATGLLLGILPFAIARQRATAGTAASDGTATRVAPANGIVSTGAQAPNPVPASVAMVALPRLLLLNLTIASGPESVETAPALGDRSKVVEILRGVVPDLAMDGDGRTMSRADRSLRIDLGKHDPVPTVVVDARGEAGAALVREILLMTGWRAFAPKTGLFVSGDEIAVMAALTRPHPAQQR